MRFNPYYNTRINRHIRGSMLPILSSLFILLGILLLIFNIIDMARGMTAANGSAWQENSIWPTIGKGSWVGPLVK